MSLGTRIALGVAVVLALTLTVLGVAMTRVTRTTLTAEVDNRLVDSLGRFRGRPERFFDDLFGPSDHDDDGGPGQDGGPPAGEDGPLGFPLGIENRNVGFFGFDRDGVLRVNVPSGFADAPDPLPRFPPIPGAETAAMMGRIVTLPAEDGSRNYRVLFLPGPAGSTLAATVSLQPVDDAVARLMRALALAGTIALMVAALASWWVIRQGLRPVDRIVETAAAIAAGDLSRRVPDASATTELGRLGAALNAMLTQIEAGIREREAGEARLRRFVADAAHELRTPLTSLRGYAELYRHGALPTADAVGHAMSRIESEGGRMARLVDDLLLLARTDQGRPLEREPVDLGRLAREAADDFAAANPERPLARSLADAAVVTGDPIRLRQAIDNLLANVRAHTPAGTPARVSVARNGRWVEVVVADEGAGIATADQARIFERFWRGDPSRGRTGGSGAGLGLSIVDALVKAHGGTVTVQSEPGRGAAFTLRLPLATDSLENASAAPSIANIGRG